MATKRASRQASSKRRDVRLWIIAATVLVVAIAVVIGVRGVGRTGRAELPTPPAAGVNAAVAAHVRERYAAASQSPRDIATVGPLCIAYHADMLFDLADRCYAIATDLEPGNWRWPYFRAMILTE